MKALQKNGETIHTILEGTGADCPPPFIAPLEFACSQISLEFVRWGKILS